ncbi:MAG TPA: hypothetical protein VN847_04340 [Streptosporangiaceae bacterium]|nr:hypothetical protein [Streptosporangiaceae bacterium]
MSSANGDDRPAHPVQAGAPVATSPRRSGDTRHRPAPDRLRLVLGWVAVAGIVVSVLVMVAVSVAGPSLSVVNMPRPAAGPPWWIYLHPGAAEVTFALWGAVAAGGIGVIAGLVAVSRGARPPVRLILAFAALAVGVLTVLPAAGSTDILDYAANGRMAATGHSPYVETPLELKNSGDPVGQWIPPTWDTSVSVYGPVATAEEWAAAELGGTSMARITFWLKLWNSFAFGLVVLLLDRALRSDPGRRLRGHLLWTANPLLWWEIVASGHIDGLAAAFGLLAILLLRIRPGIRPSGAPGEAAGPADPAPPGQPAWTRFVLAGLFIGVAAAIKIPYAAFGIGVIWAALGGRAGPSRAWRRSVTALAAAAAGFLVVLAPVYAVAGHPAISVLISRGPGTTWDTMYQIFYRPLGYTEFGAFLVPPHLSAVAAVAFFAVAILAFLRFPDGTPQWPALSPALALSLAWLLVWSYQRPWYDVMAICLLALYPASRLDWLVLGRLILTAPVYLPGVPGPIPAWVNNAINVVGEVVAPWARLIAALAFIVLCVFGWWGWRDRVPGQPALRPLI